MNAFQHADKSDEKSPNPSVLHAAHHRDTAGLERALALGADVDSKNRDGWTAAMLAVANGGNECLGLLIAAGADVDATDTYGWTAAMLAADHKNGAGLGLLIAAWADLDIKDSNGWTAAMIAARNGSSGLASLIDGIVLARKEASWLELDLAAPSPRPGGPSMRV